MGNAERLAAPLAAQDGSVRLCMMPHVLSRGHTLKIRNRVVGHIPVSVMHDELGREIEIVTQSNEEWRPRVRSPKMPFHHQAMLEDVSVWSERMVRLSLV